MKKILPLLLFSVFCLFSVAEVYASEEGASAAAEVNYNDLNRELNKMDNLSLIHI